MAKDVAQINVRLDKKLKADLRRSIKRRAKKEMRTFDLTDFVVESAKAHIVKHGK